MRDGGWLAKKWQKSTIENQTETSAKQCNPVVVSSFLQARFGRWRGEVAGLQPRFTLCRPTGSRLPRAQPWLSKQTSAGKLAAWLMSQAWPSLARALYSGFGLAHCGGWSFCRRTVFCRTRFHQINGDLTISAVQRCRINALDIRQQVEIQDSFCYPRRYRPNHFSAVL